MFRFKKRQESDKTIQGRNIFFMVGVKVDGASFSRRKRSSDWSRMEWLLLSGGGYCQKHSLFDHVFNLGISKFVGVHKEKMFHVIIAKIKYYQGETL